MRDPTPDTAFIALLLVGQTHERKGQGKAAFDHLRGGRDHSPALSRKSSGIELRDQTPVFPPMSYRPS
jgi:hypothetical protein